jgi:DNA end-binding protein Ku
VLSSRERYFLVEPMGNGLRGVALRFAQEVRGADDYFDEIPEIELPAEMMKLAQHIIRTKLDKFDLAMLEDHYRSALVRILRKKQAKRPAHAPAIKPSRANVVSLMDALRRSIAAERLAKSAPRRRLDKRAAVKRAARQRKASTAFRCMMHVHFVAVVGATIRIRQQGRQNMPKKEKRATEKRAPALPCADR